MSLSKWCYVLILAACLPAGHIAAVAVPPAPMQNYCPVVIVNRTTLNPNQLYFVAHGNDSNGIPCFLVPDGSGVCQIVYPTPAGTPSSASSSVTLSSLPSASGTGISDPAYLIYLPINASSRGYFSINHPMYLATAFNPATGVLGIDDSSVTSLTDPNYYTLYQDFEFGVDSSQTHSSTQLYLNLSWVDYFCLPMQLTTQSYPSNTPIVIDPSVLPAGTLASQTREQILSTTNTGLANGQTYSSWGNLGVPFYANPYTDTTPTTYVRILAAKNSIDLGANPQQFQGAMVPQTFFPGTYASSTSQGPIGGQSFMQAVYNYYTNPSNAFWFQIYPADASAAVYQMLSTGDSVNMTLEFTSTTPGAPTPISIQLANLSMEKLLSGSVWPFIPGSTPANYGNEISKLISGLFSSGHLPTTGISTSSGSPFTNNNAGFANLLYFTNPSGFSNGPWSNLYCNVLHRQMISTGLVPHNPLLGLGYAYDFDDLLNMSGLIQGIAIQDQYGNPSATAGASQPYTVISLESLAGTPIPDISQDTYAYNVTVGSAPNGVSVAFSYFNGTSTVTTPASVSANTALGTVHADLSHPFQIIFTFNGMTYTYTINLQRQIVLPISPASSFSAIDQYFQGGVTFQKTGGTQSNPQFLIQFNSFPPPWPG